MFIIDDIVNAIGGYTAAQQQQENIKKAMDTWGPIWQQQQNNFNPYINAGTGALGTLSELARTGPQQLRPQDVANDPGYQFQLQQGQQALQRSAAAKGMLNSGATLKGLDRYSQGLAATGYQNAWNRNQTAYRNRFGNLSGLAGMGLGAAGTLGSFGNSYGEAMSNLYGAKGNAQAAGTVALTNGASGAVRDIGNFATMGAGGMGGGGGLLGMLGGGGGGGGGGQYAGYSQAPIPMQAG